MQASTTTTTICSSTTLGGTRVVFEPNAKTPTKFNGRSFFAEWVWTKPQDEDQGPEAIAVRFEEALNDRVAGCGKATGHYGCLVEYDDRVEIVAYVRLRGKNERAKQFRDFAAKFDLHHSIGFRLQAFSTVGRTNRWSDAQHSWRQQVTRLGDNARESLAVIFIGSNNIAVGSDDSVETASSAALKRKRSAEDITASKRSTNQLRLELAKAREVEAIRIRERIEAELEVVEQHHQMSEQEEREEQERHHQSEIVDDTICLSDAVSFEDAQADIGSFIIDFDLFLENMLSS